VWVSGDAAIEASVERELQIMLGACPPQPAVNLQSWPPAGCGGALLRQTGEEVFLAQLYRRALMLNDGFQDRILHVVRSRQVAAASRTESQPPDKNPVTRTLSFELANGLEKGGSLLSGLFSRSQRSLVQAVSPPLLVAAEGLVRLESEATGSLSEKSWRTDMIVGVDCSFEGGAAPVEVHQAPVKTWVTSLIALQYHSNITVRVCRCRLR
jgi:hypothetical protein